MSLENELHRAESARQFLESPLVKDAFSEIEKDIIDRIALCPVADSVVREKLCMMLSMSRMFKAVFESHVQTGKMADLQLREKKRFFNVV
ncbi:MAG TPA: hypothetical protein VIY48_16985 [Candidatus Paceibacterota bacterium]